jgi:ParB/RepB/Spo0J family partition protein
MSTTRIPFDAIKFHVEITNPRDELKDIPDLIASLKSVGLQVPLTVKQDPKNDGVFFLVVGFRRHEAIRQIRDSDPNAFKTVEVKKFKGSFAEAQVLNITENIQRSELTPMEICKSVEILMNLGYKQKDVAEKIGKSQTWVSNAMQFRRQATPQLQEAVRSGDIPYGFARDLATLPDNEQRDKVKGLKKPSTISRDEVEGRPRQNKVVDPEVRKTVRESSGRVIRPSTAEVRHEVMRIGQDNKGSSDEFERGILIALEWTLGERKTLRRPDR